MVHYSYKITTLVLFLFIISCKSEKKDTNKTVLTDPNKDTVAHAHEKKIAVQEKNTWNTETTIGEGIVWRQEKDGVENTWEKVEITNIFGFEKAPKTGETIQVIPLTHALPVLQLAILKITPRDDLEAGTPQWYEIEVEEVMEQTYFDFEGPQERSNEFPIDVIVIHPIQKGVKYLEVDKIKPIDLPKDINKKIIKGAIDINNDNVPDALVCEFCCEDYATAQNCEYYCGKTYIKVNGKWEVIRSSRPL
ncbi:hypothetical protein [Leptobacterium sp. I13]|uniref:hypothetical protein n=1 Tax=Leptobacterium meishanense TaxID=3128904 RepID=UPI0030EC7CA9